MTLNDEDDTEYDDDGDGGNDNDGNMHISPRYKTQISFILLFIFEGVCIGRFDDRAIRVSLGGNEADANLN